MKKFTMTLLLIVFVIIGATVNAGAATKVTVWSWSQEQVEFYADMEKIFESRNPGIDLEFVTIVQKQYSDSLNLAFRGGNSPDIFFHKEYLPPQLVELGYVRPLDEFMTSEFKKRFPEEYFYEGAGSFQGKIYGLPGGSYRVARPGYLYYNRAVLKKVGLNPDRPPKTWGELREMATKVTTAGNGEIYGLGLVGKPAKDLERTLIGLASTLGLNTHYFDYRVGKFGYDSPYWVDLYKYISGMKENFFPGYANMDKTMARTMFAQNKIAFYFDGIWMPSVWKGMGYEDLDYGVAPPPVPDSGRKGYHYLVPIDAPYWYMSKETKNPEAAWKVLEFMFSQEYQAEWVKRDFGYTAVNTVDNAKMTPDPKLKQILTFADDIARLGIMPAMRNPEAGKVDGFSKVRSIHPNIWEIMTSALVKGASPQEFAAEAAKFNEEANRVFMESIAEAKSKGIKVDIEDFIFEDWDPMKDYKVK